MIASTTSWQGFLLGWQIWIHHYFFGGIIASSFGKHLESMTWIKSRCQNCSYDEQQIIWWTEIKTKHNQPCGWLLLAIDLFAVATDILFDCKSTDDVDKIVGEGNSFGRRKGIVTARSNSTKVVRRTRSEKERLKWIDRLCRQKRNKTGNDKMLIVGNQKTVIATAQLDWSGVSSQWWTEHGILK